MMRNFVRFYGLLDVSLLVWIIVMGVLAGEVPILDDLLESLEVAGSFGAPFSAALAIGPYVILISLAISGPLLFLCKKSGAYLALLQAPFRMLGVIQPSLFLVLVWADDGFVYWTQLALALTFEIFKAVSLVVWLRKDHAPSRKVL